jgi:hypothetical protein
MDTELDVLGELLVEDLKVVLLLGEELENAPGDVFLMGLITLVCSSICRDW